MAIIKIKRGPYSRVGTLPLRKGELAFTTDTLRLYVGLSDTEGSTTKAMINKPTYSQEDADGLFINVDQIDAHNGICELVDGFVDPSRLPEEYIDEVVVAEDLESLPATGSSGTIYITEDDNMSYRWARDAAKYVAIVTWGDGVFNGGDF